MDRRLTTVIAADMVGYSALIGADEEGTLAALRFIRSEIIDPLLVKHNGRVANTAGDSLLIEFSSTVEAVRCAVAIQTGVERCESGLVKGRGIKFRIGVNVGDVVAQGDDLLGDGINVAARLESLAPSGGIVLSRSVRDHIRDKLDPELVDLGLIRIKNIARPVHAFQLLLDGQKPMRVARDNGDRGGNRIRYALVATCLAIVIAGATLWFRPGSDVVPADPEKMLYDPKQQPSIAVLAFDNLTGDPDQEHVSDGLSEDIISALARLPDMIVIARNSSFSFKGEPVDVRKVAEELSVQYVLEGSLQQSDETLRITAQLIDAVSGRHVWSRKFDRPREDFFAVKDEITGLIIAELNSELLEGDGYWSGINGFKSMGLWYAARKAISQGRSWTPAGVRNGIEITREVLSQDPDSVWAHGWLALNLATTARLGWVEDRKAAFETAEIHAKKAISLDETYPDGYMALSWVRIAQNRLDEAIALGETALDLSPGDAGVLAILAIYYQKDMQTDRSIELFRRAIRIDRKAAGWVWENYGETLVMAGEYDLALTVYAEGLKYSEGFIEAEIYLGQAIAFDGLGRDAEAKDAIRLVLDTAPEITVQYLRSFQRYKDQDYKDRWLATLKRLGIPEG